ncbi:MAG: Sua5/YciO/YrdC/YwlC family protein [Buchnera aphidicola (Pentalonia nigronervosa)]|jgi:L-threonylcarbamoyladenylate synthase|uniref:Threonylcarbamoyl-AMP synthase n=1 Tax=Buchnera aphidicola (Pentalonia nigronervosa) TaxID=1309793 RepID=A0A7H1B049_9GAMM|nr:MAG: Sua5/YciO/YrdC/YwlC family protein [Buchnera aphidicola (Pentalonia nigronervosa)]
MLNKNHVIAYPTESMFALGCDPSNFQAVKKLLLLKKRCVKKGFILVAAHYEQIKMYIDEHCLSSAQKKKMFFYWPGPFTLLVPAKSSVPYWLNGGLNTVAVRISAHCGIIKLCNFFGKALISTSANISKMKPCISREEVVKNFGENFPLLDGEIGYEKHPSTIINIINGKFIRYVQMQKI